MEKEVNWLSLSLIHVSIKLRNIWNEKYCCEELRIKCKNFEQLFQKNINELVGVFEIEMHGSKNIHSNKNFDCKSLKRNTF